MGIDYIFSLPFNEAIKYLKKKVNIPTSRWDDLVKEEHNIGFMVAGAQDADLLDDLRRAVDSAVNEGTSIEAFRKSFDELVAKNGWTGWTGEGTAKGRAWRTRLIYDQNILSAYSAGRERQMADPELQKLMPLKVYRIGYASVHRPSHVALDGKALPVGDPFWDTCSPPNGFQCHCYTSLMNEEMALAAGVEILSSPPDFKPDPGFGYRPGENEVQHIYDALRKKESVLSPEIWARFSKFLDGIS